MANEERGAIPADLREMYAAAIDHRHCFGSAKFCGSGTVEVLIERIALLEADTVSRAVMTASAETANANVNRTCHICGALISRGMCLSCGHAECAECPVPEIPRYGLLLAMSGERLPYVVAKENGNYVLYSDHSRSVAAANERADRAEAELRIAERALYLCADQWNKTEGALRGSRKQIEAMCQVMKEKAQAEARIPAQEDKNG